MSTKDDHRVSTLSNSVTKLENTMDNHYLDKRSSISSTLSSDSDGDEEMKPSDIHVFSASSTLHGFSHIFALHHSSLRRFAWTVAFLTSLTLLLFQSSNRVIYYLSFPHVTRLDEVTAGNLSFPTLTLCNMNEFRFSEITKNDMYHVGQLLGFLDENDTLIRPTFYDQIDDMPESIKSTMQKLKERIDTLTNFEKNFVAKGQFNMHEFYNRTGHDISDFLLSCKYRGENCSAASFNVVFTRYGKCYQFNSGESYPPLKTLKGGIGNGLELVLDTEQDEYMPVWDETDEISIEAGFKVQIHVQTEPPFIHELGFGISPGFQSLVATQEQRITFLPSPYGNCEAGFNQSRHANFKNYSISACRITCETRFVQEQCKCRMIHMKGNGSYCTPEEYKNCADRALDYLVTEDEEICVCGTPCEVTRYNLEMSSLRFPSTQALSYLAYKYKRPEEYVRNNFVKLNIFFEALNYETIEQKVAYEIPGLFGDIGGQMGLFIGASILTILELFDYVYEVIKEKTWGRKLHKVKHQANMAMNDRGERMQIDGDLHYSTKQSNSINENRLNDRAPYVTYNHLSPLPEYDSVQKINQNSTHTDFCSLSTPPHQHFGNSLMTLREDKKLDCKPIESCLGPNVSLTRRMPSKGGRETSMSYNDLYRVPENIWQNGNDVTHNFTTLQGTGSNYIGNALGNSTTNTQTSSGNYYSQQPEAFSMSNGIQIPAITSPAHNVNDMLEYTRTIETDIH